MREKGKNRTPRLADWLLARMVGNKLHEEFFGDLEEIYQRRREKKGNLHAKLMYWVDVLHLLIGFAAFTLFKHPNNPTVMYRHYIVIALRNFRNSKAYSLINVLSLAVGMGVCLLIAQYVYFEWSYDRFHEGAQHIYRTNFIQTRNGIDQGASPYFGYRFAEAAQERIPEIKQFTRLYPAEYSAVISNLDNGKSLNVDGPLMFFVDKNFLDVFHFPLKQGKQEQALAGMFDIVLTAKTAQKYFGTEDPIGRTLSIKGGSCPGNYTVTGVLDDLPVNSHLQFDYLMPLDNFWKLGNGGSVNRYDGWSRIWFATYFNLEESALVESVQGKLNRLITEYKGEANESKHVVETTHLQAITDIHLKSDSYASSDYITNKGSFQDVQIFAFVALFILIIAYVNYVNLSTARSMHRVKEVGIRKSLGAFRIQLINQFLTESIVLNVVSASLAIGIAYFSLPLLSRVIGKELDMSLFQLPVFWGGLLVIMILGSLLSGLYPAFVLSEFRLMNMLKGAKTDHTGKLNIRKGLIVFQLLTSLILISGTYLVYKQIIFMKSQDLGMDIEKVLVIKGPKEIPNSPEVTDGRDMVQIRAANAFSRSAFQAFRNQVAQHHSVVTVTGSKMVPGQYAYDFLPSIRKFGDPPDKGQNGRMTSIGLDFIDTYGLDLIAGASFTEDMWDDRAALINEEAVRVYELGSPEEAIGQQLLSEGGGSVTIAGVVKNFHWESLENSHAPYIFRFVGSIPLYISLKINITDIPSSLGYIKSTYESAFPGNPFEYFFLEEAFNRQYQADLQFGNLLFLFTLLAIFIACIGLFALISYASSRRTKEIGIRKVLGATTRQLMLLLSREYFLLMVIAIALTIPVILYGAGLWLENFAFKTELGWDLFLLPAIGLVLIALATISFRAYSAATINPVESLRSE